MPMTPEQARARRNELSRERMRKRRAEARKAQEAAEAARRKDAASKVGSPGATFMQDAVSEAIDAMRWLKASDAGAVAAAKAAAQDYDYQRLLEPENVGKLATLHGRVLTSLHELGGTPLVRLQYELRSQRLALKEEEAVGDALRSKERSSGENVSRFERPKKRTEG